MHAPRRGRRPPGADDHLVTEQASGPADQGGHVGGRVGGRGRGPQRIDDPVEGHQAAALRGQQGQQGPGLAAAQISTAQGPGARLHGEHGAQPNPHLRPRSPPDPLQPVSSPGRGHSLARAREAVGAVGQDDRCTSSVRPRTWFAAAFAAPTMRRPGRGKRSPLAARPRRRPDRIRQDPVGVPVVDRPACDGAGAGGKKLRCRVLYVSPLKALAVDVERNLRAPLVGIRQTAERLGVEVPEVKVGVRSGDTTPQERRRIQTAPPDILITTPESLFLMLTSQARESLRGVETVIIDEVHAVAGTKRGAHLAISLERLDELLDEPAQRIGLSATVRPVDEVARFLGGSAPVEVVAPASEKEWDLKVVVPVEDMTELDEEGDDARAGSLWPHVESRVLDLIEQHKSTIVFANSRRLAERLDCAAQRAGSGALVAGSRRERQRPSRNHRVRARPPRRWPRAARAKAPTSSSRGPTTAPSPRSSGRSSRTT